MTMAPPIEATPLHTLTTTTHYYPHSNTAQQRKCEDKDSIVLHRIVTSVSSIIGGNPSGGNDAALAHEDGGDIIASIVQVLRRPRGDIDEDGVDTNSKTILIVQRMDGTTVASFDLPSSTTTPTNDDFNDEDGYSSLQQQSLHRRDTHYCNTNNLLCWASFREEANNHGVAGNNIARKMLCALGNSETLLVYDVIGDITTSLYPSTIADSRMGRVEKNKRKGDRVGGDGLRSGLFHRGSSGGGGPGGYTIPLPFRASSIFPNGDDAGGVLLIVRTASRGDFGAVNGMNAGEPVQHATELQDEIIFDDADDSGRHDGNVASNQQSHRQLSCSFPMMPKQLLHPASPQRQSMFRQRRRCDSNDDRIENNADSMQEDQQLLEDPPIPLRYVKKDGSMFVDSCSGKGVGNVTTYAISARPVDGMNHDQGEGVPCIFSLRHPLDEIHPLAVVVENDSTLPQRMHDTGSVNDNNLALFTSIMETLVFVGSPRIFHGTIPFHATTTASPICVTYNKQWRQHTIWSLLNAARPLETLPLWKTTGRGAWQPASELHPPGFDDAMKIDSTEERRMFGEIQDRISWGQGVSTDESFPLTDGNQQHMYVQQEKGAPYSFSDIHPEFVLKKLFVDDAIPFIQDLKNDCRFGDDAKENAIRKFAITMKHNIFLATDLKGSGDLVLCILTSNLGANNVTLSQTLEEGEGAQKIAGRFLDSSARYPAAVLKCYSLQLPELLPSPPPGDASFRHVRAVAIDSISHLVDLPCWAAQPVRSIPIPLAPFAYRENEMNLNRRRKSTSRFHNQDRDTFAADILIVPYQLHVANDRLVFRLYRAGVIHVSDFTLPQSILDTVDSSHTSFLPSSCLGCLENSVGDRVDIRFTKMMQNENCQAMTKSVVRASFSLLVHTSAITETALRVIESSFVTCSDDRILKANETMNISTEHLTLSDRHGRWWGATLSLLIRSDVVRFLKAVPKHVEDVGWYSLTMVLLNIFGMKRVDDENGAQVYQMVTQRTKTQSSAAWEDLLRSEYHYSYCGGEGAILFGTKDIPRANPSFLSQSSIDCQESSEHLTTILFITNLESTAATGDIDDSHAQTFLYSFRRQIFDSLHLLHEDSRLVSRSRGNSWTHRIGSLLIFIAEKSTPFMLDYEDHYHRHQGVYRCQSNACGLYVLPSEKRQRFSMFHIPPCIMSCVDSVIQVHVDNCSIEDTSYWSGGYRALLQNELNGVLSTTWMVLRLFFLRFDRKNMTINDGSMTNINSNEAHRERSTILAMLDEGINHPMQLQDELPIGLALPLLESITHCRLDPPHVNSMDQLWPPAAYDLVGRNDLAEYISQSSQFSSREDDLFDDLHSSSNDPDNDGLSSLDDFSSMIFPDNRIREAARILRSSRPIFLNVPRPVELSDHDYERSKQERLLLLCRRSISLPLGRGMLTLGTHNVSAEHFLMPNIVLAGRVPPNNGILALDMTSCPSNFRFWPEFHNGVAAGIRLPHAGKDKRAKIISRAWIKFNKPMSTVDNTGGISNSTQVITPSYAHGGFLMALGLKGYLSALTTTDLTEYLTQGIITTTVGLFLGMAANKRGTCDPSISKMLCLHVPSLLPPSFLPMDLASPVQAAAVASIGLLYMGSAHRLMSEFLLNEIGRPPMKDQQPNDREGFALVCGLSLGMVNLSRGTSTVTGLEDLHIEERLQRLISGVGSASHGRKTYSGVGGGNQGDMDRNPRVYEANSLNRDITAPGATIAIGLMYIRSNNVSIAASLKLPDTLYLLDDIRPDLLGLRVISRSLILWNNIEPEAAWIDSQVPSVVKQSILLMKDAAVRAMNLGSTDKCRNEAEPRHGINSNKQMTDFDPYAIRQANAHIVAGACFALGLKYAGSGNRFAASVIIERTLWLLEMRDNNKDVVTLTQRPDNSTLITCLCTTAISLAMVMAGTGDLDSFRLFRALRSKCDDSTLYGTHMAFGAAIGLLFLGGGKFTLGSSPEDVAMLIASFYPHFPVLSSDNQYHLQALRHLYVLASHKRILEAYDIDSNEKVCIPIELRVASSNDVELVSTPFLVPNGTSFVQLRSNSDRYFPIVINASDWNARRDLPTLFVKRKPGHLSYLQDPHGLLSLSLQQVGNTDSFMKSITLFSDDPILAPFVKYFCSSSFDNDRSFEIACSDIAHDCMKDGKTDGALFMILRVFSIIVSFHSPERVSIENIWDAKLINTFSLRRKSLLINREMLCLMRESADDSFNVASLEDVHVDEWWKRHNYQHGTFRIWTGLPLNSYRASASD